MFFFCTCDTRRRKNESTYQGAHVELFDGDMVDDNSGLVSLVESVGQHGLCFLDELFREVGPLESKGHGGSVVVVC